MSKQAVNNDFDVIVVGELNFDIIFNELEKFPEIGKEILAQKMTNTLGSSSAIFASNLRALGVKVKMLGKVGDDIYAEQIISVLKEKGVNTELIRKEKGINTGLTVALNYDKDRAMITYPGAMNLLTIDDVEEKDLLSVRHLHCSSCFLQKGLKKDIGKLFKIAKKLGLTTSLDPQWDPEEKWNLDLKVVLPHVDFFMPNKAEILKITEATNIEESIEKIKRYCNNVVIKDGVNGAYLYHKKQDEILFQNAYVNNNVVDAIGAGDSFNSGFIYSFLKGYKLEESLAFGNLTGAVNTTAEGGTSAFINYESVLKIAKEKIGIDFRI